MLLLLLRLLLLEREHLLLAEVLCLHRFLLRLSLLLIRVKRRELGLHLRELGLYGELRLQPSGIWRWIDKRERVIALRRGARSGN